MAKQYTIGGVAVEFPYKAYGPQLAYMGKVVTALEQSRLRKEGKCNALLESPTGSGKSLALLCATLAWQQHYKALLKSNPSACGRTGGADELVAGGGFIPEDPTPGPRGDSCTGCDAFEARPRGATCQSTEIVPKVPRIFYATRTHSQIKQVIREFRKTTYRVPMAILGSKKHYCTNKKVVKKKNVDEDCAALFRGPEPRGCPMFRNVANVRAHASLQLGASKEIHDIEDLVVIGHSVKGCAYFAAREMAAVAEIVFCPYSYIIDPIIREAVDADIRGSIIIFDEAHNIEDVAREAGSIDLETSALGEMRTELERLCNDGQSADYAEPLLDMVQELIAWTEGQSGVLKKHEFEHHSSCWTGERAIQELRSAGIPLERFEVLLACVKRAGKAASEDKTDHLSGFLVKSLERFFKVLQFMLRDNARSALDYQLVVQKLAKNVKGKQLFTVMFSLWCLNPATVFNDVSSVSRSVIVTSGTLAPIDSFASELGVLFDVRIEAPHVVDMDSQVWAAAVSVGPRQVVLNASFKNTQNVLFQDALGDALLEIFKVTPDGVLVFFPSYKLLEKLCDRWRSTGLWRLLAGHKQLFIEPRSNDEIFEAVLKGYYGAINGILPTPEQTSKKSSHGKVNTLPFQEKSLPKGAAFLAVCRGKVSEGIDFSDKNARAVVVVGIPFPNVKNIQVSLKKEYNSAHQVTRNLLHGDQWYCQQAFRALNQAIGRCIRHRYDYGSILLLDERFKLEKNLEYMSKWLRKGIRHSSNFDDSMCQLQEFFCRLKGFGAPVPVETLESSLLNNLPGPVDKILCPITPKPITPLKLENGLQRMSIKFEPSTTVESAFHVENETVPYPPCLRSDLLNQFDATESGVDLVFCAEEDASAGCVDFGVKLASQHCPSPPLMCCCKDESTSVGVSRRKGFQSRDQRQGAPDCWSNLGGSEPSVSDEDDFTISIADDGGYLYSMETQDINEEQLSASLGSMSSLGTSALKSRSCQLDGSRAQILASDSAHEEKNNWRSNPADCNGFECNAGEALPYEVPRQWKNEIQSSPQLDSITIFCYRCRTTVGVVCSLKVTTLQKSFLTSLLDSSGPQSGQDVSSTPVYLTEVALIKPGVTQVNESGGGVWVEEDGCVFKPLVCSTCRDFYIGVHVMAADSANVGLIGKVAIFVDSISFKQEETCLDNYDAQIMSKNPSCWQQQVPLNRARTTPLAKRKVVTGLPVMTTTCQRLCKR